MKHISYSVSKLFFYGFAFFSVFVIFFSILAFLEFYFQWNIPLVEITDKETSPYAKISIPFFTMIVGFQLSFKVIGMWLSLLFYTVYFWALKNFFGVFIQEELFNTASEKKLNLFFKLNFIPVFVGIIVLIVGLILSKKIIFNEEFFPFIIHIMVAFMVYFYMDLMKKGRRVQEENDLTI